MTTTTTVDALGPDARRALDAVADGTADAVARERATAAFAALAGDPGPSVAPPHRARIGEYLLGGQTPGRAAGTWRLLQADDDAAAWAGRLRAALGDLTGDDPPSLPGDDDARSPTERARAGASPVGDDDSLRARRAERSRRRTERNAQRAAAELLSPFRSEAIEAQRSADDRVELPDFAPRPARLALYALLVVLLAGLAFTIVARVPVNTTAIVLVTRMPDGAPATPPDAAGRIGLLVLLPDVGGAPKDADTGADVRPGDTLRVALPGQDQRTGTRLRTVSDRRLSPREIATRYRLPVGQANAVTTPAHVAFAPIRPPAGRSPESYEGTVTAEASVQTGTQRIISLLF